MFFRNVIAFKGNNVSGTLLLIEPKITFLFPFSS